jgi:hypothetical protein
VPSRNAAPSPLTQPRQVPQIVQLVARDAGAGGAAPAACAGRRVFTGLPAGEARAAAVAAPWAPRPQAAALPAPAALEAQVAAICGRAF